MNDANQPQAPVPSLKDDLDEVHEAIDNALAIVRRALGSARGDLNELFGMIETCLEKVDEVRDDICCTSCGEYNNDGEGENGLCGSCADRTYAAAESGRATDAHPSVGDKAFMRDNEVEISIASVSERQPHLLSDVWAIVDQYGETHLIEDDGEHWEVVLSDPTSGSPAFCALFIDDDDKWRGHILVDGEPQRSTACLYASVQDAVLASRDLHLDKDPSA